MIGSLSSGLFPDEPNVRPTGGVWVGVLITIS
jgi:hypothetical protein